MGVVRRISTELSITGETEFKAAMDAATRNLSNLKGEMKLAEAEFAGNANTVDALSKKQELLSDAYAQQEEKVKALERALEQATEAYGDADKRTDNFRSSLTRAKTELVKMEGELRDVDKWLDEAKSSADGAASSIDGFGKATKDVDGGGFGDSISALLDTVGGLKAGIGGLVGGAAVAGVKELGEAILGVVDDTEEYRKIMGTLENSGQQAGYTAEETAETYRQLYSVIGDNQSAATAAANLQALGLDQEQLTELTEMAIGAWSKYGDSIPIDAMAESINMAFQQNEISGALADTIDWAGGNSEALAGKLALASDASVKQRILMDELKRLGLDEAAKGWRDMNTDITEANEVQAEYEAAMGRLGEVLTPVANSIRGFGADAINWLADQVENLLPILDAIIDKFKAWSDAARERREQQQQSEADAYDDYRAAVDDTTPVWERPGTTYSGGSGSSYNYGSVNMDVTIQIGDEEVAAATYSANNKQAAYRGRSMVD